MQVLGWASRDCTRDLGRAVPRAVTASAFNARLYPGCLHHRRRVHASPPHLPDPEPPPGFPTNAKQTGQQCDADSGVTEHTQHTQHHRPDIYQHLLPAGTVDSMWQKCS